MEKCVHDSSADTYFFNDKTWVFRRGIDVERCVVSLSKGKVLKVTSKKPISIRFHSRVIESPSSLNNTIIYFLILSNFGLFAIAANPSSLYKPTLLLSITTPNRFNK